MSRTIALFVLAAWAAIWLCVVVADPQLLSDKNAFLAGFVNQEFLSFMGVVVTITLASAANLYIELNKLEDRIDAALFRGTKADIRHSAYTLIGTLVASIVVVVVKPLIVSTDRAMALVNGVGLTILLVAILILIDLTQAAFGLDPRAD